MDCPLKKQLFLRLPLLDKTFVFSITPTLLGSPRTNTQSMPRTPPIFVHCTADKPNILFISCSLMLPVHWIKAGLVHSMSIIKSKGRSIVIDYLKVSFLPLEMNYIIEFFFPMARKLLGRGSRWVVLEVLLQSDQLNMAVFFWYFGKSDLSSVHKGGLIFTFFHLRP